MSKLGESGTLLGNLGRLFSQRVQKVAPHPGDIDGNVSEECRGG